MQASLPLPPSLSSRVAFQKFCAIAGRSRPQRRRRVVSDISLMEGGNLGVGRNKKAVVGFIMSEHTQLYLPSHLSESRAEQRRGEGTFFAVFAQLKANATRAGTLIPYKERERSWGNKGGGTLRGNGARRSSLPSYPLSPALNSGAASAPHPSPALGDHSASQWHALFCWRKVQRAYYGQKRPPLLGSSLSRCL